MTRAARYQGGENFPESHIVMNILENVVSGIIINKMLRQQTSAVSFLTLRAGARATAASRDDATVSVPIRLQHCSGLRLSPLFAGKLCGDALGCSTSNDKRKPHQFRAIVVRREQPYEDTSRRSDLSSPMVHSSRCAHSLNNDVTNQCDASYNTWWLKGGCL